MAVHIRIVDSAAEPVGAELSTISRAVTAHGRVELLTSSFEERETCRRALARAGCGLGVEVTTPAGWIASLWELLGTGTHPVSALQRSLLIADILASWDPSDLEPLRDTLGTRFLLASMARDFLPYVLDEARMAPASDAEDLVARLLGRYADRLASLGLEEPATAAVRLAHSFADELPACASCVVVRGMQKMPAYLMDLLASVGTEGECIILLAPQQRAAAVCVEEAFAARGVEASIEESSMREPSALVLPTMFLEVAGPHARDRAYAQIISRAAEQACGARSGSDAVVAVVARRPVKAAWQLAERLASQNVQAIAPADARFDETRTGAQFNALANLVTRMRAAAAGEIPDSEWWPAPELSDWLACPLSGCDAWSARVFDKKIRGKRAMGVDAVLSELQSIQTRVTSQRKKLDPDNPWAQVPAVCAEVVQYLMQDRPVSAFKSMLSVAEALPAYALGNADGAVVQEREASMIKMAIGLLMDEARAVDVPQSVATGVLSGLKVGICAKTDEVKTGDVSSDAADASASRPVARFMTLAAAAAVCPGTFDAMVFLDVDAEAYSLAVKEDASTLLGERLMAAPVAIDPASYQRVLFDRAVRASVGTTILARVTHDRQAKDVYPAAIWTELLARAGAAANVEQTDEGDIVRDLDPSGAVGLDTCQIQCLPPQQLGDDAIPYVVLRQRNKDGELVARQLSASQIESYSSCPLCWFISSRVRPSSIDAGFGNIEKGNFVHDVMFRFHSELLEAGVDRVRPENVPAALSALHEAFDEVRAEHARGKTTSSAALVPLDAGERAQIDEILPQLERVVRYEAGALMPFKPAYLEYSFNGLGVSYAGWPLGGRIDRVDVDAEGRAAIIDYKHRGDVNPFKLKDPTAPLKDGAIPAEDDRWLPEHTQSLIYAQAMRRALGLEPAAALYFATKGRMPAMRGAAAAALVGAESDESMIPGLRDGFPATEQGGTMTFEQLLDRVEEAIAQRLDEMAHGVVCASEDPAGRCSFNHPSGFERRGA